MNSASKDYTNWIYKNFILIIIIFIMTLSILAGIIISYSYLQAEDHIEIQTTPLGDIYTDFTYPSDFSDSQNILELELDSNVNTIEYLYFPAGFYGETEAISRLYVIQLDLASNKFHLLANYSFDLPIYRSVLQQIYSSQEVFFYNPFFQIKEVQPFQFNSTSTGFLLYGGHIGTPWFGFFLLYEFSIEMGPSLHSYYYNSVHIPSIDKFFANDLQHDVIFFSEIDHDNITVKSITNSSNPSMLVPESITFINKSDVTAFRVLSYENESNFIYALGSTGKVEIRNSYSNITTSLFFPYSLSDPSYITNFFIITPFSSDLEEFHALTNDYRLFLISENIDYWSLDEIASIANIRSFELKSSTEHILTIKFSDLNNDSFLDFQIIGFNLYNDVFRNNFLFNNETKSYILDHDSVLSYDVDDLNFQVESPTYLSEHIFFVDPGFPSGRFKSIGFIPFNNNLNYFTNDFSFILSMLTIIIVLIGFGVVIYKNKNFSLTPEKYLLTPSISLLVLSIVALGFIHLFFYVIDFSFPYRFALNNLMIALSTVVVLMHFVKYLQTKNSYSILIMVIGIIFVTFLSLTPWMEFFIYLNINQDQFGSVAKFTVSGDLIIGIFYYGVILTFLMVLLIINRQTTGIKLNKDSTSPFSFHFQSIIVYSVITALIYIILISAYFVIEKNDVSTLTMILVIIGGLSSGAFLVLLRNSNQTIKWVNSFLVEDPMTIAVILIALILLFFNIIVLRIEPMVIGLIISSIPAILLIVTLNLQLIFILVTLTTSIRIIKTKFWNNPRFDKIRMNIFLLTSVLTFLALLPMNLTFGILSLIILLLIDRTDHLEAKPS